jgi:hypothetical protein
MDTAQQSRNEVSEADLNRRDAMAAEILFCVFFLRSSRLCGIIAKTIVSCRVYSAA